jgi:tetratricopeptide (TPR) repeat protein
MPDSPNYPGNPSLPKEVRDKILSTFRHAINLYRAGKNEDCAIGCDFILKMDARFTPARQLLDKVRNPAAPVDVKALEALVAEVATPQERLAAASPEKHLIAAIERYNARDFDGAIESANQVLAALPGNTDARQILQKSQQKKDAQPFIESLQQRALFALDNGQIGEAQVNLDKIKTLDSDHPAIAIIARRIDAARGVVAPPSPGPASGAAAPSPAASEELDIRFDITPPPLPASPPPEAQRAPDPFASLSLTATPLPGSAPAAGSALPPPPPGDFWTSDDQDQAGTFAPPPLPTPPPPAFASTPPPAPAPPLARTATPLPVNLGPAPTATPLPVNLGPAPTAAPPPVNLGPAPTATPPPAPGTEVERLLKQGDEAEGRGERKAAIEIWSRIFLYDADNAAARARIETAQNALSDSERRVAEATRAGRALYETGKLKEAREKFLEVLAIDGSDQTARTHLERIEDDLERGQQSPASHDLASTVRTGDILADDFPEIPKPVLTPPPSTAPENEEELKQLARPAAGAQRRVPARLALAAVAIILAGAAAYYFFLRPAPTASSKASPARNPVQEARNLFMAGQVDEALATLRAVPRGDPNYATAHKLLSSYERNASRAPTPAPSTASSSAAPPVSTPAGTSSPTILTPEMAAHADALTGPSPEARSQREAGEAALAEYRFIDALKNFDLAARYYPNDEQFQKERNQALEHVQLLAPAVKLYNEADYETALPMFWRIYHSDRNNADARSYLIRSYYNLALNQLQTGNFDKAAQNFKEVLNLDPTDVDAERHRKFAEHYAKSPPDLLARIYSKYSRPRP